MGTKNDPAFPDFLIILRPSPSKSRVPPLKEFMLRIESAIALISRSLRAASVGCRGGLSLLTLAFLVAIPVPSRAQETPYFVTYSHDLEEPGDLDIELKNVGGAPARTNAFAGSSLELEYGATGWWTTEFYLSGQATASDSTIFTGFRWENRVRPFLQEHWINPVLYVEFEDINAADKNLLEVVGHDSISDLSGSNAANRREKLREMELKLILSRNWKGWNFSENTIFEKNLSNSPWEFGYAAGASRPLSLAASPNRCVFCAENFVAGVEMYGGLGDRYTPGLHDTSHYLSPAVAWTIPHAATLSFGPGFGLNDHSAGVLLRFGVSTEIEQFGNHLPWAKKRGREVTR